MPPKKLKLSSVDTEIVENANISKETNSPYSLLCSLPNEILEKIFSYLNIETLLAIQRTGFQRLTCQACSFQKYDFSSYNTVKDSDMEVFFAKERTCNIKDLNLSNVMFLTPAILTKHIAKCKQLTVLSVINCGICYLNIYTIAKTCQNIQELYWSVPNAELAEDDITSVSKCPELMKIRKLFLWLDPYGEATNFIVDDLTKRLCRNAKEVCLNFTAEFSKVLLPNILLPRAAMYFVHLFDTSEARPKANILVNSNRPFGFENTDLPTADPIHLNLLLQTDDYRQGFTAARSAVRDCPGYFQFCTSRSVLPLVPADLGGVSENLLVFLDDNYKWFDMYTGAIKKGIGKRMKHLSFNVNCLVIDDQEFVYSSFCDIILTCTNITELNLCGLHLDKKFSLSVLKVLEKLDSVCFSACLLKSKDEPDPEEVVSFTEGCQGIQHLHIVACLECAQGPTDERISFICKLTNLKSLILDRVFQLRLCPFLPRVAESCPELSRLEINRIGPSSVCHFVPSLAQMLQRTPKLRFLRLNQPAFYPMQKVFWRAVKKLENLQGLCITTVSKSFVANKDVVESIKKLKFLHLFHFGVQRHSNNLQDLIRKAMRANGIKNCRVAVEGNNILDCTKRHF